MLLNDRVNEMLTTVLLRLKHYAACYRVHYWEFEKYLAIVCLSIDDFLISTKNEKTRSIIKKMTLKNFKAIIVNKKVFKYLNCRIIQLDQTIAIDQAEYINNLMREYFPEKPRSFSIPFTKDRNLDREIFNLHPCNPEELTYLEKCHGESHSLMHGQIMYVL